MITFKTLADEYLASMIKLNPRRVLYPCRCGKDHDAVVTGMQFRGWEPIEGGPLVQKWPHRTVQ